MEHLSWQRFQFRVTSKPHHHHHHHCLHKFVCLIIKASSLQTKQVKKSFHRAIARRLSKKLEEKYWRCADPKVRFASHVTTKTSKKGYPILFCLWCPPSAVYVAIGWFGTKALLNQLNGWGRQAMSFDHSLAQSRLDYPEVFHYYSRTCNLRTFQ